ncbi:MAG TPA: GTPase HflX [Bacillota bacterium]|jgi:GTP-binding protein HflX|nr:GTPase HflX [Fastidiosipila sp.]HQB81424.1 GTPase HflX [Bacillota bacterium]
MSGTGEEAAGALLVAVDTGKRSQDAVVRSLDELEDLAGTNGFAVKGRVIQRLEQPDGLTFVGSGKLLEIAELAREKEATYLIFDGELTPAQTRGITDAVKIRISDRVNVILSIFADRARTDEGKIQVELAWLRYRLTQLTGRGVELSRLGGGIGTRGPGETKLEQDRRVIRKRMGVLRSQLRRMEGRRERSRALRHRREMITAAIVGYTNAGKSTLLNKLSDAELATGDQLFMTLDPTARRIEIHDGLSLILVDTVGFIRDLPDFLLQAFRATFEEAASADLILLVCDMSDPDAASQIEVVQHQLNDLGAGMLPLIYVLNKMDQVRPDAYHDVMVALRHEDADRIVQVSALTGEGLVQLKERLARFVDETLVEFCAALPYAQAGIVAHAREYGSVTEERYEPEYILLSGRIRRSRIGPILPWIKKS